MKIYTKNKKNAFTLAEVLITLGIVGVVAAMTIPALIANYQKNVWEAKLKKSYSIATNACERMLTTEGVSRLNETELSSSITNANIRKYFKVIKDGKSESKGFSIYLPDGAVLYLNNDGDGFKFFVDVNGATKPNKAGRDQFEFRLDKNVAYDYSSTATTSDAAKAFKAVVDNNWKIPDNFVSGNNPYN